MGDKCSQMDRDRWAAEDRASGERRKTVDGEGGFVCPKCGSTRYHDHFGPQEYSQPQYMLGALPRQISHSTCAKCGLKFDEPRDFSRKKTRFPVFVWKKNSGQVGAGSYPMAACLISLGVHVFFRVYFHCDNERMDYFQGVDKIIACDNSCQHAPGHIADYSKEGSPTDFTREPIVDAALAFRK